MLRFLIFSFLLDHSSFNIYLMEYPAGFIPYPLHIRDCSVRCLTFDPKYTIACGRLTCLAIGKTYWSYDLVDFNVNG